MTETDRFVALLRGVNVGGVRVKMDALRALAEGLGWAEVRSVIARGNLLFRAGGHAHDLAKQLHDALKREIGIDTPVMVLRAAQLQAVLDSHPWTPDKGNQSHIYFCWAAPTIDENLYASLKAPEEALQVIDGHVHFYAPNGIGRSQLAEKLGKVVRGTAMTGRNLNTVRKLAAG